MSRIIVVSSIALILCNTAVASDAAKGSTAEASRPPSASELPAKLFTPDKLKQDLDFLFKTIEDVHPNMYAYTSKKEFAKYREALYSRIDHPMNRIEFYKLVAPIVASLKSGHTYVVPFFQEFSQYAKAGGKVLPLAFHLDADNLVISKSYGPKKLPVGSRVLAINAEDASKVVGRIARRFAAEGRDAFAWHLEREVLLQLCFWIEYGPVDSLELQITTSEGTVRDYTVNLLELKAIQPEKAHEPGLISYCHIPEHSVGLIRLDKWPSNPQQFRKFLDETFKQIHQNNVSNLIVDLRGNPGGNDKRARMLLEYLTDQSYRLFEEAGIKFSSQFLEKHGDKLGKVPEKWHGQLHTDKMDFSRPKTNKLKFEGRIFILIGQKSTSTTTSFAAAIKHFNIGTLVGEQTGDTRRVYGDTFPVKLPNTGLQVLIACKYFVCAGGSKDPGPVIPHHEVKQKAEDTAKGIDTVLQFTLDLIKKSRAKGK